ncbi:MAG: polyketide cyclase [Chitinophagaceae bacterium]|nr:SRPBCC family protein [Sphingobacteriales bacterium]OJW00036.1 MAG: polyketide cyclase [Sphingobacteriales bacterium 44-61]TXJ27473.1 MAG: polyketide cyclase [Chitinophagaceae bacterium]
METATKNRITVETIVKAPVDKVWKSWNEPEHIMNWCHASDDWHAPASTNDIRTGGTFSTTMAAKDGSYSFDFGGVYDNVKEHELIQYTMGDGRKVEVIFTREGNDTKVVETFEAESTNPLEMQRSGWQAILDNFKKYTESL